MTTTKRFSPAWMIGLLLLWPFALLAAGAGTLYFAAAFMLTMYLVLLVVNFEAGFWTLVFIRSSLDGLKQLSGGGGFNAAAAASVALIVLGVFYVLYRRANIFKYEDTRPFLIFLAICGISVVYSPDTAKAASDWLRLLSVFSVYVLTRMICVDEKHVRHAFVIVLGSALIPAFAALLQGSSGVASLTDFQQARLTGTFLHPNAFASYVTIILIICTTQLLEKQRVVSLFLLTAVAAVMSGILVLTFSRGAWVAFILAMTVMGFLRYRRLLLFLPVALIIVTFLVPAAKDRVYDVLDPSYMRGHSAWEWRLRTWSEILPLISERPWLGHGLSTVEAQTGVLAHNDYLRLLVETGIAGLGAYLLLVFGLLRRTWQNYLAAGNGVMAGFQAGLLAVTVGFLVRQTADNMLRNTVVMMYFWFFVAVARNTVWMRPHPAAEPGPSPETNEEARVL